jgi:signal transduction histidine kinase
MTPRKRRSLSLPIVLSVVSVVLSIALLVGWIWVLLRNQALTQEVVQNRVLMAAGVISLGVIMAVLVLFTVFLVREILEVRRQTSFIDSVTHELKSPLAALRLCLETMARPELDGAQRNQLRGMMSDDIERLVSVIDGILQASRIEQGTRAREFAQVDTRQVIEDSIRDVTRRRRLQEGWIDVDIRGNIALRSDGTALRTIFENLLDNAVKYSNDPPRVVVSAWQDENDLVLIEVRNEGIGIARRDLRRIFERFYRAPEEGVRARYGTGLGLFVVAALVRDLGGKIEAHSDGLGKGACFRLIFRPRN